MRKTLAKILFGITLGLTAILGYEGYKLAEEEDPLNSYTVGAMAIACAGTGASIVLSGRNRYDDDFNGE